MQFLEDNCIHRHVAQESWSALPSHDPFHKWFLINFIVPGATYVHVMCTYSASPEAFAALTGCDDDGGGGGAASGGVEAQQEGWSRLLRRFWAADDQAFCNARFKLFPRVVEANWGIKMAVGSKPALIGKKLKVDYFRGENYMEVDVDISSSSTAYNILSMV